MVGNGLKKIFVLAIFAAALVIGGCGSSSDDGTADGGTPLTAAAYGKQAEAICKKTGDLQAEKVKQVAAENSSGSADQAELAELTLKAAKPVFQGMVEELEELEPPAGKKGEEYQEWVDSVNEAVDKMEASPDVAVEATVESHHKARSLGLEICSLL